MHEIAQTRAFHIETRAAEDGSKRYRFRASSTGLARDGMVIDAAAWRVDNYLAHPVVLASHDYYAPLSIGRATSLERDDQGLIAEVEFDPDDDTGSRVMRRLDASWPVAMSVGFRVNQMRYPEHENEPPRVSEAELLELSIVSVPSDPAALPIRSLSHLSHLESLLPRLDRLVSTEHVPERPATLLTALALVRQQAHGTAEPDAATRVAIEATIRELQQVITPAPDINQAVISRLEEIAAWLS